MFHFVRRLAVVAHFDASRALALHFRRALDEIVSVTDRVVVVSTSGVDADGRRWLQKRGSIQFIERANVGYDFKSFQVGFQALGDPGNAEVLFCNDSFVGPLIPLESMFRTMEARSVDFWGMTRSQEIRPHVQSYFMAFSPRVVRSEVFRSFWREFATPANRAEAIERGELRLSPLLEEHGFTAGAYFEPTGDDVVLANKRFAYLTMPTEMRRQHAEEWWDEAWRFRAGSAEAEFFNPTIALADAALDGRLPLYKIEAFRLDPWEVGGRELGESLVAAHPRMFEGVQGYLSKTDYLYRGRYESKMLRQKFPEVYDVVRYRS